jgi:single-stranded DNA-binding protein
MDALDDSRGGGIRPLAVRDRHRRSRRTSPRAPELRHAAGRPAVCRLRILPGERVKDASGEWADRRRPHRSWPSAASLGEWVGRNLANGEKVVIGRLRWRERDEREAKRQAVDISAHTFIRVPRTSTDAPDEQGSGPAGVRRRRRRDPF